MNLGERVECGLLMPRRIGLTDRRVDSILAVNIEASTILLNGEPLTVAQIIDDDITKGSFNVARSGAVFASVEFTKEVLATKQEQLVATILWLHFLPTSSCFTSHDVTAQSHVLWRPSHRVIPFHLHSASFGCYL